MNLFKKFFDFYLDSSIHIGLSVYSLTYITLLYFRLPYDEAVLYFTFYGTIVTYNFIKYGSSAKKYFFMETKYLKVIQLVSFGCFVLALYYAVQLQVITLLIAVGLTLLSSLYIIPFLPNQKNFRTLPGFKISIVALCWTGVTVILPMANANILFATDISIVLVCVQRFILILILMIPFEISDLSYDEEALGTLPQRIGIKYTKYITYVWIGIFLLFAYFLQNQLDSHLYVTLTIACLLFLSIWYSNIKKSKYYTAFWVESIPIVWLILLLTT